MIGQKGIPARFGGVETHVENVATRLAVRGHEISVFCRTRYRPPAAELDATEGYEVAGGVHTYKGVRLLYRTSINTKHLDASSHTFLCALESSVRHGFDIVHFHGIGPSAFAPVPKLFGKKVISTFHALDWRQVKWGGLATRFLKAGESAGARSSDGIIAVSQIMKRYVAERYGIEAEYIPNGATMPTAPRAPIDAGRFGLENGRYVLAVGRIIRDRGLHYLIEAFKRVSQPAQLVIVGSETPRSSYSDELEDMADRRVVFTGDVFGDPLEDLYANCSLYVLASVVEGLPITVCEAMAHGRPMLLSDIPENREVAGDAAVYFNAGDISQLHLRLEELLEDREARERLSAIGLERARTTYNWDRIAEQVEAYYWKVLGR